jgi:hypothetical protein
MTKLSRLILICFVIGLSIPGKVFSETETMNSLVPAKTPDGWVATETPQVFTKETLFEHINGQADLFLQYGFERSISTAYEKESGGERIDLDVYDMGDVVNAFGIFSRFRQDDHSAGIGLDAYLDDRYAFFYKGKYFVILQGTDTSASSLKQFAEMMDSRISDTSPPPREILYFPTSGLKLGSIEYYPQGLMGRQFLGRGFKATYVVTEPEDPNREDRTGRPDSNLFIAVFDNPAQAESALKTFKETLSEGGNVAPEPQHGFDAVKGEDAYRGKLIIVQKGRYLAGAVGFEREEDAESLLAALINKIE